MKNWPFSLFLMLQQVGLFPWPPQCHNVLTCLTIGILQKAKVYIWMQLSQLTTKPENTVLPPPRLYCPVRVACHELAPCPLVECVTPQNPPMVLPIPREYAFANDGHSQCHSLMCHAFQDMPPFPVVTPNYPWSASGREAGRQWRGPSGQTLVLRFRWQIDRSRCLIRNLIAAEQA